MGDTMNAEEEEIARTVWEDSEIGTERSTLIELARHMVPPREFNRLQSEFKKEFCNPYQIISEILTLWKSFKPNEATLSNLEKKFRVLHMNAEASKQLHVNSIKILTETQIIGKHYLYIFSFVFCLQTK